MSSPPVDPESCGECRRDLIWIAVVALLVFLPGIGSRDLWNPDEPRYAEVARVMLQTGEFIVPHLNGQVYSQKPPLLFWSIAFFGAIFGEVNEVAARLPSALAALLAILMVYLIGRRLFSRRVGLFSAAIFGSCFKILWQGHVGQIDMLLTALVSVAIYFWMRSHFEKKRSLFWLFFVFAGFATLAKGPVGLLPPLLSILVFLAWRDRLALRDLRLGKGLLLWAVVVMAWLGPALYLGGERYQNEILFKQNVQRYVDPWHHHQPPYYYLTVIPADFMPWSLLLPAALWIAARALAGEQRERWRFLWIWVIVTLIFFSLSPAKRTVYVLTLYPALALLVGLGLDLMARRAATMSAWWTRGPMLFLTGIVSLAAVAAPIVGPRRPEALPLGPDFPWLLSAGLLVLAVLCGWAARELWRDRIEAFLKIQAAAFALFGIFLFALVLPRMNVVKSARYLSEILLSKHRGDEPIGHFPNLDATFLFYTHLPAVELSSESDLHEFVDRPGRIWLLAERDDFERLRRPVGLVEVARDRDLKEGYILFGPQE